MKRGTETGFFPHSQFIEKMFVCTCRMDLIQSALDRGVSGASQKTFPDKFGSFLTSPDSFEVGRLVKKVKKRRNFDLNLSFIHVTF